MMGPGRYDPECTFVTKATKAHTVIVIVMGGDRGSGFSCQTQDPAFNSKLPAILRATANEIERSHTSDTTV